MRNIGIIIVLALWILLGWKMCTDYTRCCTGEKIVQGEDASLLPATADNCSQGVICFADNSCDVSYGVSFTKYRDSLISLVNAQSIMRITGVYNTSESYDGSADNLGACRAESIRAAFASLEDDQISTGGQITIGRNAGIAERFLIEIINKSSQASDTSLVIGQSSDRRSASQGESLRAQAVIYFPFNSTNKLNNSEIEAYLDQVAARTKGTSQKVRITGHTDDIGDAAANTNLGQRRANIIADYLMGQGVLRSQIISESNGESQPVASNSTEVGRAKNRRAELQIIK